MGRRAVIRNVLLVSAITACAEHAPSLDRPPVDSAFGVCVPAVNVNPGTATLHVGDTARFAAAACRTAPTDWRWRVSDTAVATIDSVSGLARGKARGLTSVIAVYTLDSTVKGAAIVSVVP